MINPYLTHFQAFRKSLNRQSVFYVVLLICSLSAFNAVGQVLTPSHHVNVAPKQVASEPAKEKSTATDVAGSENTEKAKAWKEKWSGKPLDNKVFAENKGQYDKEFEGNDTVKILYRTQFDNTTKEYFLPNGVLYKNFQVIKDDGDDKDAELSDPDKKHHAIVYSALAKWEGANNKVVIQPGEQHEGYWAYGMGKDETIRASIYKKLTYNNIYPGIDVIYSFPDKGDIKYTLIVHPGADLSLVKLNYTDAKGIKINANGDALVQTDMGTFTDKAPVSNYEGGGSVNVEYVINGNQESFVVKGGYDKTQTLIIDPITITSLTFNNGNYSTDWGYDLDYDNAGNSYVGGGYYPYGVAKYNSAGTYQWTYWMFNADPNGPVCCGGTGGGNWEIYGGFAVNKNTSDLYCVEGFNAYVGSWIEKVNTAGTKTATFTGNLDFTEMWRAEFNECSDQVLVGGGGVNSGINAQVAIVNSSLTTLTPENPINDNGPGHDVVAMAMDPTGDTCFMAMAQSSWTTGANCPGPECWGGPNQVPIDPNFIFSTSVSSPTTTGFLTGDGYNFQEDNSIKFVGNGLGDANGMNGMACSPNYIYMYDGKTVRKYSKKTGIQLASVNVPGGSQYKQGGIAADGCDNVYVGDGNDIYIYNSGLGLTTSTALSSINASVTGTIYAIRLGLNDATLWVTGQNFLVEFINPFASVVAGISTFSNTTCGQPNGSATASLSLCSGPAVGVTYSWLPGGQTTQTATGLSSGTYTVSMTVGCEGTYTTSVTIGASTTPTLTIGASPSTTVCAGTPVTLTGNGGSTGTSYNWTGGPSGSKTWVVTPASTTTYTVTDAVCGTSSKTITITVNPLPGTPVAGSNSPICVGQTLNLSSTNTGGGWSWTGPNGFTSTVQNPSIAGATALAAGTYNVTETSGGCTSGSGSVVVTVNALPANPTLGSNSPVCAGGTINLTSTAATSYSWTGPNSFSSTVQNPSIGGATAAASGTYSLTIKNAAGCSLAAPATINVTVNPVPGVPTIGSNSPICAGQNLNLTSSGTGGIYNWTGPNSFTSTTQNPTITAATTAATGTYFVTNSSVAGCPSVAASIAVTVNPLPANPSLSSNSPICAGQTLNLSTTSGGPTYAWSGPGGFTSTLQNPSIAGATIAATGTYTLHVTSAAGCGSAAPGTIAVTVNAVPPTPTIGGTTPVCSGQTINLTSSAAGASSYSWTGPNSFTSTTQNPSIPGATVAASGNYTVTASAAGGCVSPQAVINITVNPTPAAPTAGSNSPICAGATLNLTGSGGSSTYHWTGPNLFNSALQNPSIAGATTAATGIYTLTTTSALGCTSANATVAVVVNPVPPVPTLGSNSPICSGANLNLTSSSAGATSYSWSGPNLFNSGVQNPTITAATTAAAGIYTVTAKIGTCVSPAATITVVVNPTPTINVAPAAVTMCPGATATLIASNTAGAGNYTWTPNTAITPTTGTTVTVSPAVTTTYTVNETSSAGCPALPVTDVVTIANSLTVTVTPAAPAICDGSSVNLNALGASTFTWRNTGTGLSCTTCANPTANPTTTTTYTVVGKSGSCSDSTKVTVTVNPAPVMGINITGVTAFVCSGDSMGMTATPSGLTSYAWTPVTGLSCTSCISTNAGPSVTTTYTVTGTNSFGCSSTATQVINVYPKPVITMTPSSATICAGDTVTLHASGITTYNWAPDSELNVTTGPIVIASPTTTVTYTVSGKGTGGCQTKDSATVSVNPKPNVTIVPPNPSVCAGTGVPLTASGANNYAWTPTTGLVPAAGSSLTATPTVTTTYQVIGTSLLGCKDTVHETVTINPNPIVTVSPPSPAVCFGDSVNLISGGAGIGATYTWTPSTGLNFTTGDSVWAAPTTTGTYSVTGTTAAGCVGNSTVTIGVGSLTVTAVPAKSTLCTGNSTKITAGGAGTFTWKPAAGLSATTGSIVTATPDSTTTYTIIGTAGSGCTDSTKITITVNTTPTVTVSPASTLLCFGAPGDTIRATGAGPGGTYAWKPTTDVTNIAGDSVVVINVPATAVYTVTGTTALGCPATHIFTMTVDKVTVTASASSAAICIGDSTNLKATGASTYAWKPSSGLNTNTGSAVYDTGKTSQTYMVVGTDALGCSDSVKVPVTVNPLPVVKVSAVGNDTILCNGSSTTLNATGASTYVWSPAIGLTPASGSSVAASPSGTQVYTVTGTNAAGCKDSASISVTINTTPIVTISLSGGNTVCPGQPFTMSGNGASAYSWVPSTGLNSTTASTVRDSITSGPITYTVTGSNGICTHDTTVTVNIYPKLIVTPVPDSMCSGKSANVEVSVAGGNPAYTYSWSSGITGNGPGPYPVSPGTTTGYTCLVTDACGDTGSAVDPINVSIAPVANFTPTPSSIIGGQFVAFIDNSTNATIWQWTFGNGGTSDSAFPYYQYVQPGQYVVILVVSNSTGCTDTAKHIVTVIDSIYIPNVFTPNGDGINDVFHVTAGGLQTYNIEIFNRWGERMFLANSAETDWDGRSMSGVPESDGDYYYIIKATDYAGKSYTYQGYIQLIR